MKIHYFDNPYTLDDGRYLVQFDGVEQFHSEKARDRSGQPIPPGWKWRFIVAEGPEYGKTVDLLTSKLPTAKNACGRIMMALTDGTLQDGDEFDPGKYHGYYYRITVRDGKITDNPAPRFEGTHRPSDPPQAGLSNKIDEPVPF